MSSYKNECHDVLRYLDSKDSSFNKMQQGLLVNYLTPDMYDLLYDKIKTKIYKKYRNLDV